MNTRSIATVSISGALDEKLKAIAAAGFEAVEIFENDLIAFGLRPREIRQMCRCLLYTSPSPRDLSTSRMPSSA